MREKRRRRSFQLDAVVRLLLLAVLTSLTHSRVLELPEPMADDMSDISYAEVPGHILLTSLDQMPDLSFEMWLKLEQWMPGAAIISKPFRMDDSSGDASNILFKLGLFKLGLPARGRASLRFELSLERRTGDSFQVDSVAVQDERAVPIRQWVHVACTYDYRESTMALYINAHLRAQRRVPEYGRVATQWASDTPLFIGRTSSSVSGQSIVGRVDELRFWNYGLSAGEVRNAYRITFALAPHDVLGLIFYLTFDSGVNLDASNNIQLRAADLLRGRARIVADDNAPVRPDTIAALDESAEGGAADAFVDDDVDSDEEETDDYEDDGGDADDESGMGKAAYGAALRSLHNERRARTAVDVNSVEFGVDASYALHAARCHYDIDIVWQASLGSNVFSDPLIADLGGDGRKEVVVATHNHFIEVLKGHTGAKAPNWPFGFTRSSFVASPLAYDIDKDGHSELLVCTQNGEVVFLSENGLPLDGYTLKVPELRVPRDWYEGVNTDLIDVSFSLYARQHATKTTRSNSDDDRGSVEGDTDEGGGGESEASVDGSATARRLLSLDLTDDEAAAAAAATASDTDERSFAQSASNGDRGNFFGSLTAEGIESLELFMSTVTPSSYISHLAERGDPLYSLAYERWLNSTRKERDPNVRHANVLVDAHVLATPTIADLDSDGVDELIVAVSYFFDNSYTTDLEKVKSLGVDVDPTNYVACGLVVFSLATLEVTLRVDLDLTTQETAFAAFAMASPTIVDLDLDGRLDIVVGTGAGYLYALESDGAMKSNFPLHLDSLFAEVIVDDVTGDGRMDIVAVDTNSNLVCFAANGDEQWEQRLSGFPNSHPTIGDIDGDGVVDIVVATNEGHLWAVRGTDGEVLRHFPVRLGGIVLTSPLLVDLQHGRLGAAPTSGGEASGGASGGRGDVASLQAVVHAQDGHLYVVDGRSGCVDKLDIGEDSYSTVMADDVTGNGLLDLVLVTRVGHVYCLSTRAPFDALMTWPTRLQGASVASVRYNRHGVRIADESRVHRDVTGRDFAVAFEIVDERAGRGKVLDEAYEVVFSLGFGGPVLSRHVVTQRGVHRVRVRAPHELTAATLVCRMTNAQGQVFYDSVAMSFNVHTYRLFKWLLAAPFALMVLALLVQQRIATPLPSVLQR